MNRRNRRGRCPVPNADFIQYFRSSFVYSDGEMETKTGTRSMDLEQDRRTVATIQPGRSRIWSALGGGVGEKACLTNVRREIFGSILEPQGERPLRTPQGARA
jgi:hypothetical protein